MVAESRGWDWAKRQVQSCEGDVHLWVEAVQLLDRLATRERLGELEALLRHEAFCVREAAATPYAKLLGAASLPLLLEAWDRGLEDGHDNDGLSSDVTGVVSLYKAEAVPILAEMFRSKSPRDRAHAAWLWGYLESEVSADPLLDALHDPDPDVRGHAAGSLSTFKSDPRVLPALLRTASDPDVDVRVDAVSALGYLGDRGALSALRQALSDPVEKVRRFAEYAIGLIDRPGDRAK